MPAHAGVPMLAMPEPAYLELRRSPLDFIEIRDEQDVVSAVDSLRRNPYLYRRTLLARKPRHRFSRFGEHRQPDSERYGRGRSGFAIRSLSVFCRSSKRGQR
jgi:hypothetical protein